MNEAEINTVRSAIILWVSGNKTYVSYYLNQGFENYRALMNIFM